MNYKSVSTNFDLDDVALIDPNTFSEKGIFVK
jgi:hypothetical protein